MPRALFVCHNEFPYHITARVNNRDAFPCLDAAWTIMEDHLFGLHHFYHVKILAFVLMNNHFHLLAYFPHANASTALRFFMRETSRSLSLLENSENHLWGARFYRTEIATHHYYLNAYKYVYQNPVRAGVCEKAEDYRFSTLRGLLGLQPLFIPIEEDRTLFSSTQQTLSWLHERPLSADNYVIQQALKKSKFKIPINPATRTAHHLDHRLL